MPSAPNQTRRFRSDTFVKTRLKRASDGKSGDDKRESRACRRRLRHLASRRAISWARAMLPPILDEARHFAARYRRIIAPPRALAAWPAALKSFKTMMFQHAARDAASPPRLCFAAIRRVAALTIRGARPSYAAPIRDTTLTADGHGRRGYEITPAHARASYGISVISVCFDKEDHFMLA